MSSFQFLELGFGTYIFSCDSSSIGSNVGRSVGLSVGRSVTNHELEQSLLTQFQQYISVIVQCNDA